MRLPRLSRARDLPWGLRCFLCRILSQLSCTHIRRVMPHILAARLQTALRLHAHASHDSHQAVYMCIHESQSVPPDPALMRRHIDVRQEGLHVIMVACMHVRSGCISKWTGVRHTSSFSCLHGFPQQEVILIEPRFVFLALGPGLLCLLILQRRR